MFADQVDAAGAAAEVRSFGIKMLLERCEHIFGALVGQK
jgi:hypothetical protein